MAGISLRHAPLMVACTALLARLLYLIQIRATPLFDYLHLDPLYYVEWGRRVAGGAWLADQVFEQSPLYPYLLGAFFSLFGDGEGSLLLLRLLQLAAGTAGCVGIHLLARQLFDARVALVAGLLAAVYGPFLFYEGMVMKSFLTYLLSILALWALLRYRGEARGWLLLCGVAVGLTALVRANALLLAPALALWTLWRWRARGARQALSLAAVLLLGTVLAILPATAHNLAVSGEWVLITSGAGEVFYIGNHQGANGAYLPPPFVRPSPAWEHEDFRSEAVRRINEGGGEIQMSRAAASRYWFAQGLSTIRSDPWRWVRLEWRKLALFWNARELPDNYSYDLFARHAWLLRLALPFGLIAPLGLVGMLLTWRRWRELLPLHLLLWVHLAGVLLFFNFSRFRLPVVPVLLVFAGAALVSAWDGWRQGKRARSAAILGGALLLALPLQADLTSPQDAPGQEEVLEGFAYLDHGSLALAEERFARARETMEAFHRRSGSTPGLELGSACFGLGSARLRDGRAGEAVEPLTCAVRQSPQDPGLLQTLAEALLQSGRPQEAEEALTHAVELRPRPFAPYFDLANLLFQRGDAAAALAMFERGRQEADGMSSLDLADYHLGVAIVHLELRNDRAAALPHLREVLLLAPQHDQAQRIRGLLETRD